MPTLFDRIKSALRLRTDLSSNAGVQKSPGHWEYFSPQFDITQTSASTTAEACINLIIGQLAPMRRVVMRDKREVEHPINDLLRDPWPQTTPFTFYEIYLRALLTRGNAYAIVMRDSRRMRPLMLTPALDGGVTYDDRGRLIYTLTPINQQFNPTPNNLQAQYPASRVCAANWFGFDGLTSPPPLRRALTLALQQQITALLQRLTMRAYESGPYWGYHKEVLDQMQSGRRQEAAVAEMRRALAELQTDTRIPIVQPGVTPTSMPAFSLGDLSVVELLRWTVEDICRVYGVSPSRLGQMSGGGAGVRTQALQDQLTDLEATAIRPVAAILDGALTRGLFTARERMDGYEVVTETWPIGLGSMEDRANIADQLVARAMLLTPNEARQRFFNLPPIDGGDELLMPKGAPTQNASDDVEAVDAGD